MGLFKRIKEIVRANDSLEKEKNMPKKTLFNLEVGDVICVEEIDYEVEGIIGFTCDGWKWIEYKLKDSLKAMWLSIEMDDELEISIYEEIKSPREEINKKFTYDGVKYYFDEGGIAIVEKCEGLNIPIGKSVQFMEYCDDEDEKYFAVETWDEEKEFSIGREIKEYNVEIYG